ncbi:MULTISPECIES: response regulator [unclassified Pseudomonas]|uniref:response regulator n=1 Tax=unclassified Pseudomonas TaxID=196821 RepID=UPI0005EBDEC0|nr:response regulator [Pseudomonas sp. GM30]
MTFKWEEIPPIDGTVVVIEDDPILRALMEEIVSEVGGEVMSFGTADDALTYLLQNAENCRLVIADHGVPGQVKGLEFINIVRHRWPTVATILTSGYLIDPWSVPDPCIYLHKPWALDELVIAMATLLQKGDTNQKT